MPSKPPPGKLSRGVAEILRAAYSEQSLTQAALGARIGVTQSQMSKLLRGERTLSLDQLEVVCFELGLSPGEVVLAAEALEP